MSSKQILWDLFTRGVPVILVYLWKKYDGNKKIKQLKIDNNQFKAQASLYPQIMRLKNDMLIEEAVQRIFKQTNVIRFLILVGANGKEATAHVSVIYSRLKGEREINPKVYVNIPTDKPYRKMLHHIKKFGEMIIDVFEMPRGLLKSIYYKEMISHSIVKYISTTPIDENNNAFVFSSISTDTEDPISAFDKIIIDKEFTKIKQYLKAG